MAALRLKVRPGATKFNLDDYRTLDQLAAAFEVELPEGCDLVFFGQLPPADLKLRWQELDVTGTPVGQIKSWSGSTWV